MLGAVDVLQDLHAHVVDGEVVQSAHGEIMLVVVAELLDQSALQAREEGRGVRVVVPEGAGAVDVFEGCLEEKKEGSCEQGNKIYGWGDYVFTLP